MLGECHQWVKAIRAGRISSALMREEAGMAGCRKEGAGSLHSGVEVKGLRGVSVQVGGVNQESSWRERFVQPQLDTGAEVAPEGLKGWASEFDRSCRKWGARTGYRTAAALL